MHHTFKCLHTSQTQNLWLEQKCPPLPFSWPKYSGGNVRGENVRGRNVLGRNVGAPHIHGRTSFVILCNASIKRNGQSATTYTLLYTYTDIFRWQSKG